ncbi:hypothetical protein [uncultured Amphritea sp.]|uniref:hypothetical protein n=1 Tax=uncultured Amphritea sp. TaxID=981605 RepID=UPI002616AFF4|nr:hypothetical protein [uncultured Amphritea sp.]
MSRSLYELCCRYANGELDSHEYRQLRRRFIDHLVNSSDRTQPVTDLSPGELTQPHSSLVESPDTVPIDKQAMNIASSGFTTNVEASRVATENRSKSGKWLIIAVILLLVTGALFWLLNPQNSREQTPLQSGSVNAPIKRVASVPLLSSMHDLLDQDKWSITNIEDYSLLLLQSSPADKSALKSDSRYHQFLDMVHIYQVLAEADQNAEMIAKLDQLERDLRD